MLGAQGDSSARFLHRLAQAGTHHAHVVWSKCKGCAVIKLLHDNEAPQLLVLRYRLDQAA